MKRSGVYACCAWLTLAALLGLGAYWGLAIAGPSGIPAVLATLVVAAGSLVLAGALWTGFGGRKVAILSLILGLVWAAFYLVYVWIDQEAVQLEAVGGALFGVAISLTSAFALRGYPRPRL